MVLSPRITAGFIIRPLAGQTLRIIVIRVAPREGSDKQVSNSKSSLILFQSTPPARGATEDPTLTQCIEQISIHAPREGSDPIM